MTKGKHTAERRLMVNFSSSLQSYHRLQMEVVVLMLGDVNPSDGLSKIKYNNAVGKGLLKYAGRALSNSGLKVITYRNRRLYDICSIINVHHHSGGHAILPLYLCDIYTMRAVIP